MDLCRWPTKGHRKRKWFYMLVFRYRALALYESRVLAQRPQLILWTQKQHPVLLIDRGDGCWWVGGEGGGPCRQPARVRYRRKTTSEQRFFDTLWYSPVNCILVPLVDVCDGTHDVIGHRGDMIAGVILVHTMIHMWWMVSDVLEGPMGHMRVVHGGWGVAHVGCVNAIIILYKSGNKYAITNTDHTDKFQNNLIYKIKLECYNYLVRHKFIKI